MTYDCKLISHLPLCGCLHDNQFGLNLGLTVGAGSCKTCSM